MKEDLTVTDEPLGTHVLELQLADVIDETADARSLVFKVPDGPDGPMIPPERLRHAPGQFLTLRVPSDRTGSVARCYSLSSSPFTDDALTVTVKRTAGGYASNWLCDNAHPGMHLHVLAPSGTFVPKTLDADFLLLAAGSGITPMMAILKSALSEGSGKVTLFYANRDEKSVIFGAALRDLATAYPDRFTAVHWVESVQGLPSPAALANLFAPYVEREVFICGPGPFMVAAEEALGTAGAAPERIHLEVFKSLESDPFAAVVIEEDADEDGPPDPPRKRSSRSTGKPKRSAGPATRSCSTCSSTRASMRRSPAAKVTAALAQCSSRAETSTWTSTTFWRPPTWTRGSSSPARPSPRRIRSKSPMTNDLRANISLDS